MSIIGQTYFQNSIPRFDTPLTNGSISENQVEEITNKHDLAENQSLIPFDNQLSEAYAIPNSRITEIALARGLYLKPEHKELALISGAGIAGLAASFELLEKGYDVVIAEKRKAFTRDNIVNLNVETQHFLKKFNLLAEFESSVAARISSHTIAMNKNKTLSNLNITNVNPLQDYDKPFKLKKIRNLFKNNGIYSVKIKDLQNFLVKKISDRGAHIIYNRKIKILERTKAGGVSEAKITDNDNIDDSAILKPDLFFIAEGAHSKTVKELEITSSVVKNACSGENWIFGNVDYSGNKTFVISIVDVTQPKLEIANVIFNETLKQTNIAVTSEEMLDPQLINERILDIAQLAFSHAKVDDVPQHLTSVVTHPVHVENEVLTEFSKDNIFAIGDVAIRSSPLAGLGATLCLTLVPHSVEQLLIDRQRQSHKVHENFEIISKASGERWIAKSNDVKNRCHNIFHKEQLVNQKAISDIGAAE